MRTLFSLLLVVLLSGCAEEDRKDPGHPQSPEVDTVAIFTGQQVTGVSLDSTGRIFVNFPRWQDSLRQSVAEVVEDRLEPFPNGAWNAWQEGDSLVEDRFVSVQSILAHGGSLFVLDTRNPKFQGVLDAPRVYEFSIAGKTLLRTHVLDSTSYYPDTYINDIRVDSLHQHAYITDSGHPGLIVLNLEQGNNYRVLNEHYATSAEMNKLKIDSLVWKNTVHADGIALDGKNERLYFHALTAYSLYSVAVDSLLKGTEEAVEASLEFHLKTSAPDGMIIDGQGNLYYADLENHKIRYLNREGIPETLLEGPAVRWADTFSIHDGWLYYTNSRIHEAQGDISEMDFTLNRVRLPAGPEER